MKKVIILGYLIGLIGFQSFTRENAAKIFIEPKGKNAHEPLFKPLEALWPNIFQSLFVKDYTLRKTNPLPDTLGIIPREGEINLITRLDGFKSQKRDGILGYVHFAADKNLDK